MLKLLSRNNRNNKRRNHEFTPASMDGVQGARLEARALTAPAIWRRPPADPRSANDEVAAGSNIQDSQASDTPSDIQTTMAITALCTALATDLVNPAGPAAPIGTATVSFSTTVTAQTNISSISGDWAFLNPGARVTRDYLLADDTTGTGPSATLVEQFLINVAPDEFTMGVFGNYTTPNLFLLAEDAFTLGSPNLNGTTITPGSSGTMTGWAGGTINYSLSGDGKTLEILCATNVGTLPVAVRNPDGTIPGVAWPVQTIGALSVGGPAYKVTASQASITTSYEAFFI